MNAEATRRLARDAGLRAEDVGVAAGMDVRAAQDWLSGSRRIGRVQALRVRQEAWRRQRSELIARAGLPKRCPDVPEAGGEGWAEHRRECPTCRGIDEVCELLGPAPSGDLWSNALTAVIRSPLFRIPLVGMPVRMVLWILSLVPALLLPVLGGGRRDPSLQAGVGCSLFIGGFASVAAVVAGAIVSLGPWGRVPVSPGGAFAATVAAVLVLGIGARSTGRSHIGIAVSAVIGAVTGAVAYASVRAGNLTVPPVDSRVAWSLLGGASLLALLGISAVEGRIAMDLVGTPEVESGEVRRNGI